MGQLDQLVGREGAAHEVQSLLEGASQRRAGLVAAVVGSIAFVAAATGAFLGLQAALNTIWRVKPNPGVNLKAFEIDRLRSFGLVVGHWFSVRNLESGSDAIIEGAPGVNSGFPAISPSGQPRAYSTVVPGPPVQRPLFVTSITGGVDAARA